MQPGCCLGTRLPFHCFVYAHKCLHGCALPYAAPSTHHTSEVSTVINPCDPNPCAQGFFCSINHMCQSEEQFACSPYSCQPGCIVGETPAFVLPTKSAVRVSLVASNESCYGYFNCSPLSSSSAVRASIVGFSSDGGHSQPLMKHCEDKTGCTINGSTYGEHLFLVVVFSQW